MWPRFGGQPQDVSPVFACVNCGFEGHAERRCRYQHFGSEDYRFFLPVERPVQQGRFSEAGTHRSTSISIRLSAVGIPSL